MQWFKHDSNAASDAKIRRLILRYGATGYALYFYCLELIMADVHEGNLTFRLEHDSEMIADALKIQSTSQTAAIDLVNQMMAYMIELGLFEESNGDIFCFKLLKRLDSSMTSNKPFREMIAKAKDSHDAIMIQSCKKRLEENKKELGGAYALNEMNTKGKIKPLQDLASQIESMTGGNK